MKLNYYCKLCKSTSINNLIKLDGFSLLKCQKCKLVFISSSLNGHNIRSMYNKKYFETRHDYYFKNQIINSYISNGNSNINNFRYGLSLLEKYARPGRLLDLGCALGIFLSLAKMNGWNIYGIDISEYAVSCCNELFGYNVISGELKDANFPDEWFDAITLWDVIEHFKDPGEQLKQIHRILKKDGILLMDTPNENGLLRWIARVIFMMSLHSISYPMRKVYHKYHLYYYSPKTLKLLLENNGFSIVHIEKRSIPIVKARGRPLERALVKALSYPEKLFGLEYELLAIAKKM